MAQSNTAIKRRNSWIETFVCAFFLDHFSCKSLPDYICIWSCAETVEIYKHKIFIKWAYYHMVLPRNSRRNLLLSENFSKCILAFWGLKNLTFCNVMLSGKWKNFIKPKDNVINIKRKVIYFIKQFFTVGEIFCSN